MASSGLGEMLSAILYVLDGASDILCTCCRFLGNGVLKRTPFHMGQMGLFILIKMDSFIFLAKSFF